MTGEIDMLRAQREEARWRILRALDAGRPNQVSETIILRVLQDISLALTVSGLRRELDYLEERSLVKIHHRDEPTWTCELTRHGVDLVEYTQPCDPGIARPKKWD
jgi:Fe2+ or Zn2+ uptake regulation protein